MKRSIEAKKGRKHMGSNHMSGLDKIIQDIKAQTDAKIDELMAAAREKADAVIAKAQEDADKTVKEAQTKAERESAQVVERAHSSAQLKQQKMILSRKQELIDQVMEKAKETILGQSDSDYFDMIKKMVSRFKLPEPGTISFAKKDLDRLPPGLKESVAEAVGADVAVSEQPANIDGGFVLSYGGIEENCSIDAIFRSEREGLQDCISDILFKN